MSRYTKRDKYGHAYTNETIYDRGMTSKDGKTYEKHYFENGGSAYDGKPIDRLCDLEDKIEQGDVVEVVRCKDCKHLTVVNKESVYARCEKTGYIFWSFETDTREHFCAYGERRTE